LKGQSELTQVPLANHVERTVVNKVSPATQLKGLQVITNEVTPVNNVVHEDLQNVMINADKTKNKLEILEKRLRMIEGASICEFGDAVGLCLVPDVVIPPSLRCRNLRSIREFLV